MNDSKQKNNEVVNAGNAFNKKVNDQKYTNIMQQLKAVCLEALDNEELSLIELAALQNIAALAKNGNDLEFLVNKLVASFNVLKKIKTN